MVVCFPNLCGLAAEYDRKEISKFACTLGNGGLLSLMLTAHH